MTASTIWSTTGINYPASGSNSIIQMSSSPSYNIPRGYFENNFNNNNQQMIAQISSSNNNYLSPHYDTFSNYNVNNNGYSSSSTTSLPSPTDYYNGGINNYQNNWNYDLNSIKNDYWENNDIKPAKKGGKQHKIDFKNLSDDSDDTIQQENGGKIRTRRYKTPSPQILRARRQMANARERRRMNNLNVAYESLREVLPEFDNGRRLSKMETLQMAHLYIQCLGDLLQQNPN